MYEVDVAYEGVYYYGRSLSAALAAFRKASRRFRSVVLYDPDGDILKEFDRELATVDVG